MYTEILQFSLYAREGAEIYFEEIGEYLNVPVKIMNTICSDVIIHDFIGLGMVKSVKCYKGETWTLKNGPEIQEGEIRENKCLVPPWLG